MRLNNIIIVIYLLISAILFISFFENIFVWSSFFINWLFLTILLFYHLKIEKLYSPFLSAYITFNYLFLILAPVIQISAFTKSNNLFPNFLPYAPNDVVYANIIILVFHIMFFFGYLFFKHRNLNKIKPPTYSFGYYIPLTILIILMIGTLSIILSFDYLMSLITESYWRSNRVYELSVSNQLIIKKVLYMIPFGGVILAYSYLKNKKRITKNTAIIFLFLIFLILILFFIKNPLTEKRNAIGPIYITLLFLFVPKLLNSNSKIFLFLFLSLVIFFPLVSGLTHLDASINEIFSNPSLIIDYYNKKGIIKTFNSLHYDAFSNIIATLNYVKENGFSLGYQLLGGLLFFIPRSIWTSKPNSTGELIGDFAIDNYGFGYNNLSNPIVSEGYVNFGIFGVVFMALALAFFVVKFIKWLQCDDPLKRIMAFYFAVHLMFLLRGDFTNGFAYFVGTLVGVLIIPKAINRGLKIILKKNNEL